MSLTEKLYFKDSHIKEFKAAVISCEEKDGGYAVILDKTAFFPEGGGQPADTGVIGAVRVHDVQEQNGEILHFTKQALEPGEYLCSIDWQKRFERMQNHSGEHIVSGIVHSEFGYDNVGFHMEDGIVAVDFSGELTREQLDSVEEKANEAVFANLPVTAYFPEPDELASLEYRSKLDLTEDVRIVKIGDVDTCACCAPHVTLTGEIGTIKLLDFMRHRGGIRVYMKAGKWALDDYREKYTNILEISNLLSAKQPEAAAAVSKFYGELDSVRKKFFDFKIGVAKNAAENMLNIGENALLVTSGFDADMLRETVNCAVTRISGIAAAFSGDDENGYSYICCDKNTDMNVFAKKMNAALSGRGGGRDGMIQGKVTASKAAITEFFNELTGDNA